MNIFLQKNVTYLFFYLLVELLFSKFYFFAKIFAIAHSYIIKWLKKYHFKLKNIKIAIFFYNEVTSSLSIRLPFKFNYFSKKY